jgi:hypothetical protein
LPVSSCVSLLACITIGCYKPLISYDSDLEAAILSRRTIEYKAEQRLIIYGLHCISLFSNECWEYGIATGGSVPFTWLRSDRKVVQESKEEMEEQEAVK